MVPVPNVCASFFPGYDRSSIANVSTASADRRPVDPPPVVELRIYESDPKNDMQKVDITFTYNATFFLYATLEPARPIAQGRVANGQTPPTPVLTGVPVAGIAYLDRPAQAGYFIFPDLSVRHEGIYRLSFNLFEEVKDPRDADENAPPMPAVSLPSSTSQPSAPTTFLHFRLEVKSVPFTVYSAKKFPGLKTSTSLSRVVAEQGCRVRIRRDVRMRRRGEKTSKNYDEEQMYSRSRYTTPDPYANPPIERPRSTSCSSVADGSTYPYNPDGSRRPSIGYQQPPPPPPPPPQVAAQYAHAAQHPVPVAPAPPNYQQQPQHLSFGSTQSQYAAPPLPSVKQQPAPNHSRAPSDTNRADKDRPQLMHPMPQAKPVNPPSITMDHHQRTTDSNSSHHHKTEAPKPPAGPSRLPSLKDLLNAGPPSLSNPPPPATPRKGLLYETASKLTKRSHAETFGHEEQRPLQNGQRPDAEPVPREMRGPLDADVNTELDTEESMSYRRADGSVTMKMRQVV